ncbi:MAG: AI-2E family transporter [Chitinophagaceae bacterium]
MTQLNITRSIQILILLIAITVILYFGKSFLVPVVFAALLAMLFLPLFKWLQNRGFKKSISIITCILIVLAIAAGIISLISWQISDLAKDADSIERNITQKVNEVRQYFTSVLGISQQKQEQVIQQQQQSSTSKLSASISGFLTGLGNLVFNFILVIVYMFLFIYYRGHLKNFVLKLVNKPQQQQAQKIMTDSSKVIQKYLTGLALMIVCLWIMYGIGFSIVGVKNAIFFAILCGLLEIVPFVGNLVGTLLTILVSMAQGGDMNLLLGIVITYGIIQFIQTYLLEPLVVGREVDINPIATIAGLVAGELLWGIPGMVLAIPVLGICKIVFDNIENLKPYGYLIGEERKRKTTALRKK